MAARGEKITSSQEQHGGKEYDPRYTFKNSTIIDWLKITDDEQRRLKTIISKEIKQERNTEAHRQARREAGAVSRDIYEGKALERRQEALRLSSEGLNNSQIAKQMGVSRASVINYLKSEFKG
jgi:DNA-binding NarL/FixJ family response regulator